MAPKADPISVGGDPDDDDVARPPLPRTGLPGALRAAAVDFYYQSIRLVPANVAWGVVLMALAWAAIAVGLWVAVLAAPLLAIPLVGIYRLAGHVTRAEDVVLSDAGVAMRERLVPALVLGAAVAWGSMLLATNVAIGLGSTSPLGWAFATFAGWGFVAMVVYTTVAWPLLADPARRAEPARQTARLAALVVLAAPVRMTALAIVAVVLGVVSTVAFVAVITISIAYIALVSCRVVLPAADDLAARLAARDALRR